MKRFMLSLFVAMMIVPLFVGQSYSIPAFARKYKTSCQTCHNGYPKLNAFGEAFRRNGYQFPGGTDPEYVKEEPVSLGSDGNKKAFPDAIWPGTLPETSPIALFLIGEVDYNPNLGPRFSFDGLGNSIETVASGTLGEDLSFWGHMILHSDGTVELNRVFLAFSNLIGDNLAFNVKVGVFEPGLFSFSTHRAWVEGFWMTTRPFSGDMGWTIEETQKGIEVYGLQQGRFSYNAGIVEGFGSLHSDKDYYAHLTYKFGGLPLDGVIEGGAAPNNPQPYIDNSFTVGTFVYRGNAALGTDSIAQPNSFTMAGGDVNLYYDRFNLFGGVGVRHDEHPFLGVTEPSANTTVWFTELDVVLFPWLLPELRYENWNSHQPAAGSATASYIDQQFVPGIMALVRPNVKMTLSTAIQKFDSRSDSKFQFDVVSLAMEVGI